VWRICIATSAPSVSWTVAVTTSCARASDGVDILPANGDARPWLFGAIPPVTISPTPPAARALDDAAARRRRETGEGGGRSWRRTKKGRREED
jgi:hypothetical protein